MNFWTWTLQAMNQTRSQQHQQAEIAAWLAEEAEGLHSEQHQNFQIIATSCFGYLGKST